MGSGEEPEDAGDVGSDAIPCVGHEAVGDGKPLEGLMLGGICTRHGTEQGGPLAVEELM